VKKHLKKLSLSRETLRILETGDARKAVGGHSHDTSCACEEATHCECASQGGTDCYPPSACFGPCSCG
jgi:hypothetical protein